MAVRRWTQQVRGPVLPPPLTSCVVPGSSADASEPRVQMGAGRGGRVTAGGGSCV